MIPAFSERGHPVVFWEDDPGRTREVVATCAMCRRFLLRESGLYLSVLNVRLVSPSGCAHVPHDHDSGFTACGRDATGPDWWWRT